MRNRHAHHNLQHWPALLALTLFCAPVMVHAQSERASAGNAGGAEGSAQLLEQLCRDNGVVVNPYAVTPAAELRGSYNARSTDESPQEGQIPTNNQVVEDAARVVPVERHVSGIRTHGTSVVQWQFSVTSSHSGMHAIATSMDSAERAQPEVAHPEPGEPVVVDEQALEAQRVALRRGAEALELLRARRAGTNRVWSVRLDSASFSPTVFDADAEELELELVPHADLRFPGTSVRVVPANAHATRFEMTAEQAERAAVLWTRGRVEVEVDLRVGSANAPEEPVCSVSEAGVEMVFADLLRLRLVDSLTGDVLATHETESARHEACDRFASERRRTGAGDPDGVTVEEVQTSGSAPMTGREALMLTQLTELTMAGCLYDARQANASTQGAVVLTMSVDEAGRIDAPEIHIDTVQSPVFRACILEALPTTAFPRERSAQPMSARITAFLGG